jgi:hypothetical protein
MPYGGWEGGISADLKGLNPGRYELVWKTEAYTSNKIVLVITN